MEEERRRGNWSSKLIIAIFFFLLLIVAGEFILLFWPRSKKLSSGTWRLPFSSQSLLPGQFWKRKITAISDDKHFSVQIANYPALVGLANEFRLLAPGGVALPGEDSFRTVKRIEIHYTSDRQAAVFGTIYNPRSGLFAGSSAQVKDGVLQIRVFLLPTLYREKGRDKFSRYFSINAALALFRTSAQARRLAPKERQEKLRQLAKEIWPERLFVVQKRE